MKRITGSESYYQFAPEKSLRENLEGKAIVEYPELIIAAPTQWAYYHSRLTDIGKMILINSTGSNINLQLITRRENDHRDRTKCLGIQQVKRKMIRKNGTRSRST